MQSISSDPPFVIAIPIYEGVDLMDVAAPTEMFFCMNGEWQGHTVQVVHVAETAACVRTRDGTQIVPHATFEKLPKADLLWTPGGDPKSLERMMYHPEGAAYLAYLQHLGASARWVTSVCEGALLLAKAGLLSGYNATTHWAFMECLRDPAFGVNVIEQGHPRYVVDRNRITGAGISAGMDEALAIIEIIAGTGVALAVQQITQYFPRPPVMGALPASSGTCPVPAPKLIGKH